MFFVKGRTTENNYFPDLKRDHTCAFVTDVLVLLVTPEMLLSLLPLEALDFLLSLISVRAEDTRLFLVGTAV